MIIKRFSNCQEELSELGRETTEEILKAVKGYPCEEEVKEILSRSTRNMREKVEECKRKTVEQKEYSSEKEKENIGSKKKGNIGAVLVGDSLAKLSNVGSTKSASYFKNKLLNSKRIDNEEAKVLIDKLVERAKKQGTRVVKSNNSNSVATEGGAVNRAIRKGLLKLAKKNPSAYQQAKWYLGGMNEHVAENLGKDAVVLGRGILADPEALAHELGHTQYTHKGRTKDLIGKAAHKVRTLSDLGTRKTANAIYAGLGYKSGLKSARLKAEGKKEKTWDKVKSAAIPALIAAPLLISEGAASRKGLKFLKEAGASKEAMKIARKNLGNAYGTYVSQAAGSVASGAAGRLIGKAVGKRRYKKEEKDK